MKGNQSSLSQTEKKGLLICCLGIMKKKAQNLLCLYARI